MKAVYLRPYCVACTVDIEYSEIDFLKFIACDVVVTKFNDLVVVSEFEAELKNLSPCTIINGVQFYGDVLIIKRSDIDDAVLRFESLF